MSNKRYSWRIKKHTEGIKEIQSATKAKVS